MTDSLEIQGLKRMLAEADALGLGDHPETERMREILLDHAPVNGGAMAWWRANKHLPEVDWPAGCCWGNDSKDPSFCLCWEPVFDVDQVKPKDPVDSWEQCKSQVGLCHDCAYRPNSPERTGNPFDEEALIDMSRSRNQIFFCHQGIRRPVKWVHPDGREVPADPKDYQPVYVEGIPYQADGTPGLVCGGWWAFRKAWEKEVATHPVWLQDLVDMQHAREILPGGMVWVDGLPPRSRHSGAGVYDKYIGDGEDLVVKLGRGETQRTGEAPETPRWIRRLILEKLRENPGRWARVYDGGQNSAAIMSTWYQRQLSGNVIDAATRRHADTTAVYARYLPPGVM